MLALDLSSLPSGTATWKIAASIPLRDPLASEGVTLALLPPSAPTLNGGAERSSSASVAAAAQPLPSDSDAPRDFVILAFGGYNGEHTHTHTHTFRLCSHTHSVAAPGSFHPFPSPTL
jgi:hypothetical protein